MIDADAERIIPLDPPGVQPRRVWAQLAIPIIVARQDFWYRALYPMSSNRLATTTYAPRLYASPFSMAILLGPMCDRPFQSLTHT